MEVRTYYRIKNEHGNFFTGNKDRRFDSAGRMYESFAEAEFALFQAFRSIHCSHEKWVNRLKIIKEEHHVVEKQADNDFDDVLTRWALRQKIQERISKGNFRLGTRLLWDMDHAFPDFRLNGMVHVMYFPDVPISNGDELKSLAKQVGLKRGQFKTHNRSLFVKHEATVASIKLAYVNPVSIIHVDLSKL